MITDWFLFLFFPNVNVFNQREYLMPVRLDICSIGSFLCFCFVCCFILSCNVAYVFFLLSFHLNSFVLFLGVNDALFSQLAYDFFF